MGRLFGTDGVRGVVGEDLTEELAVRLGHAAALVLGAADRPVVVIGRDTRASGQMLEAALARGIRAAGGDVLIAGVQTTPAIAFLTDDAGATAGAVISASHNPPAYNGIKFFDAEGYKLDDALEDEIEARLADAPTSGVGEGSIGELSDGSERYVRHLVAASDVSLETWSIVIDCANGAGSWVAPDALRRLGAEVTTMNDRPDGSNINEDCGAMHPEIVAMETRALGAHAGIALDGDADRAVFADQDGEVIDGDQVIAACAQALHRQERLTNDTVVSTVMANLGFRKAMESAGITNVVAAVGDRYVLEEMKRTGAILGGEQSGHVIFADQATTGDGILTAIRFLGIAEFEKRSLGDLAESMRRYPQVLVNVRVGDTAGLEGATEVWAAVGVEESVLADRGRILLRASGTEPLIRVMVEAETEEEAKAVADRLAELVRKHLA